MTGKKVAPLCQCSKLAPIGCDSLMTAEDLLCDACRAGCNCVFSKVQPGPLIGFHFFATFTPAKLEIS